MHNDGLIAACLDITIQDVLRGAAEEVLAVIKDNKLKDPEKQVRKRFL